MIDVREAERIDGWVKEAQAGGAQVLTGGKRDAAVYWPTVLTDVSPEMKVVAEEAFAPVASVIACDDFEEALRQADATEYGLQVGVFTRDIDRVFQAIRRLNFGGVIVNDTPAFRVDHMPYGGNRQSGLGREGVRFAMEEMTNIQMVAIRTDGLTGGAERQGRHPSRRKRAGSSLRRRERWVCKIRSRASFTNGP